MQAVADSQSRLSQQQQQLEQLQQYQKEYENQQVGENGLVMNPVQLSEFRRFMGQLDLTIQQQKQQVDFANRELQIKRQKWIESKSKAQAITNMIDSIRHEEQKQLDKVEQKLMDEYGLRKR